ncbi:MAG: pyridoxamine 5'-phosphate oxidase [Deltaproteobacteria bacterium]|nr:pyridoxamine 5'-phosphate oxidase [Deltaproteobacteria bacterium]
MSLLDADALPTPYDIWALWSRATVDTRSPFRTPTIATVGLDGTPEARTVVLRDAQQAERRLVLHSDSRAGKVRALRRHPTLAWHFWNPRHRLQVRASGPARLHRIGPVVDTAWAALSVHQQRTYAASPAPGTPLEAPGDGLPDLELAASGRDHFCVIEGIIQRIDILQLRRGGHRRCVLQWVGSEWTTRWVVP